MRFAAFNAVEQLECRRLFAAIQVTTGADGGTGSLRNAIVAANAAPGSTIEFSGLAGNTPIILNSALPPITAAGTTIDGTTDTDGTVEIKGTGVAAGGAAIDVQAATVVLNGLAIVDCDPTGAGTYAIRLDTGSSDATVEGCYIGILPDGTAGANAGGIEILSGSSGNTIGGTSVDSRNVLGNNGAGTGGSAIRISGAGATDTVNNTIEGNYIGLDPTGLLAAANGQGIQLSGTSENIINDNYICASDGLSSGGGGAGITTGGGAAETDNTIEDNMIGLNTAGTAVPNVIGVVLGNPASALTGDTVSGNTISDNTESGVDITGSDNTILLNTIDSNGGTGVVVGNNGERNTISQNSISLNGATFDHAYDLGIDLGDDGVTPDTDTSGTTDMGANGLTPFPVLTVFASSTFDTVNAALQGNPNTDYTIEFFSNDIPSTSGYGQGSSYLGTAMITTDSTGAGTTTTGFPFSEVGNEITATATNSSPYDASTNPDAGATSEFALNVSATGSTGTTTPAINLSIGNSVTLREGHSTLDKTDASFTATVSGPFTVTVNYGDGTGLQSATYNSNGDITLIHAYDGHISYTYVATVTVYTSSLSTKHTFDVTVVNNPPHDFTVKSVTRAAATTDVPFEAIGRFADAGAGNGDHFRLTIDYGDGTTNTVRTTTKSAFEILHQYTHPGHYKLQVTVIDDGGGVATFNQVINVFAPTTTITD